MVYAPGKARAGAGLERGNHIVKRHMKAITRERMGAADNGLDLDLEVLFEFVIAILLALDGLLARKAGEGS